MIIAWRFAFSVDGVFVKIEIYQEKARGFVKIGEYVLEVEQLIAKKEQ